jgi:hypothetical protein
LDADVAQCAQLGKLKMIRKIIFLLFCVFVVSGCTTNKGGYKSEHAVESRLLGMSKDDVLIDLGPPTKKTVIDLKVQSWRYESEVGGLTGGECTLALLLNDGVVTKAKLSANDLSWVSFPLGSCTKIIQTLR